MSPLFRLRLRFGGQWKAQRPNADEILDLLDRIVWAIGIALVLFAVYHWVNLNDQLGDERARTAQAERMTSDCLHNGAVFVIDGQGVKCRAEWIKVGK